MSSKIIASLSFAAVLGSAHWSPVVATVMNGSFSGTMSSGTDVTGVFGTPGTDLTGDTVIGTFAYDTAHLSQSIGGGINTATGTGLGGLTVTITIGGQSHTFTDQTSAGITLDTNISGVTLQNVNSSGTIAENFFLDASDIFTPFITSTSLIQPFSTTDPFSSGGSFSINDTGPNVTAGGAFTLGTLATTEAAVATPEPASLALLTVGVLGIGAARTRARRSRTAT